MLISICVATYQRPEGLKRLIDGLDWLIFERIEVPTIEVIVVDNDPNRSAQEFCTQIKPNFNWNLKYFNEPQRGISYVRNKAIIEVSLTANFVAFIDDDEVPEPNWLEQLLIVQQATQADVVAGPALPFFPMENIPQWIVKGRFFEPERYPTGHTIKFAGAGNVLIQARILNVMGKIFDERFALTGGEDSHFFMRVDRAGYKLVWADSAIVYEWIPKSRMNIKWILQRGYRCYSSYSLSEKELDPGLKVVLKRMATGSGRIAIGLVTLFPSILLSRQSLVIALLQVCRGGGTLLGLMGKSYTEYKTIHGE
jgi:glycosyltransferase involved in cell wall biosynthesis